MAENNQGEYNERIPGVMNHNTNDLVKKLPLFKLDVIEINNMDRHNQMNSIIEGIENKCIDS